MVIRTEKNPTVEEGHVCCGGSYQAYQILRVAFALLAIVAGLDKFFNVLTIWEQYLSVPFNLFKNPAATMMVVGIIEIIAGIGVAWKPRIFAYVIAVWLLLIIINLLTLGFFFDVALRDLALLLGAVALGRLASVYNCRACCRINHRL